VRSTGSRSESVEITTLRDLVFPHPTVAESLDNLSARLD
jgi:hypothetical protein